MPTKKAKKRKAKQIKNLVYSIIIIIALISALAIGLKDKFFPKESLKPLRNSVVTVDKLQDLTVRFMDIGQGDAIFIDFPDGKTMLIDFGKVDESVTDEYLTVGGKKKTIDYLVATHPDDDHIGNLPYIYKNYTVNYSYRPYVLSENSASANLGSDFNAGVDINKNTVTYHKYINSVYEYNANNWEFFYDDSDFSCDVVCNGETHTYSVDFIMPYASDLSGYSDFNKANDFSALIMVEYAGRKLLFTGDAESHGGNGAEDKFVQYYSANNSIYADCDVLKVGHHGSKSSTSEEFLSIVKPEYAVISCGVANSHEHPNENTINSLIASNAEIYRTDLQGTIVLTVSEGGEIAFKKSTANNDGYLYASGEEVKEHKAEIENNKK